MSFDRQIALSVVIVTPDRYVRLRKTIEHLLRQTVKDRMEVVIGAPSLSELDPDLAQLSKFGAFQLVELGALDSPGRARAAATRRVSAAVTVYTEDHCWPEPEWAAALLQSHRQEWAGVGATLFNANPNSILSWAALILNFGPAVGRESSLVSSYIPWHNSAYKTELLLSYGEKLGLLLEAEGVLQADLEKQGHKLFLQAQARTAHMNVSLFSSFCREQFLGAQLFWSHRAEWEQWPAWRRLVWSAGTPGLALVRSLRSVRETRRIGFPGRRTPVLLIFLGVGILCLSLGAFIGILLGRRSTSRTRISLELDRCRHLLPADRALMTDD